MDSFRPHGEGNASVYARSVARADCPPAPGTADGNRVQCLLYRVSFFKHQPGIRVVLVYPLQSRSSLSLAFTRTFRALHSPISSQVEPSGSQQFDTTVHLCSVRRAWIADPRHDQSSPLFDPPLVRTGFAFATTA